MEEKKPNDVESEYNKWKNEHYKCGLRKWSCFPLSSRIRLIVSVISLIVALGALLSRR